MSTFPSVFRYRIRNWHEYNRALINRGCLTIWLDEQVIVVWRNPQRAAGRSAAGRRSRQPLAAASAESEGP